MALGLGPKPPEDPKRDAAAKPQADANIPPPAAPPPAAAAPPAAVPPAAAPPKPQPSPAPPKAQPAPQPQPSAAAPQSQPSASASPKPAAPLSPALEEIAAKHDKREAGAAASRPSAAPRRRTAIGFTVALSVASAIAIWGVVAFLSSRYAGRPLDVTHQREFTLAPETRELLKRVKQPLHFTAIFNKVGDVRQHVLEEIETLVGLFRVENRWVDFRKIDPDRDAAATFEIISRLKLENDPQRYRDAVVVEYGDRSQLVPLNRIASVEILKEGRRMVLHEKSFEGEAAFASAILNMLENDQPKVYFTAGHGELDLENPNNDGLQYAKAALREEKLQVDTLFLLEKDKIPDDAAAVIIAGPVEPFDVQEVAKLEKFLERGGGLFVGVGPRRHTNLEPLLSRYGIELGQDIVVDPSNKRAGRTPTDLIVRKLGNHPIVNPLATSTIEDPLTRSVKRVTNNAILPPHIQRSELLFSSDKSWAETDFSTFPKVTRNPDAGDLNGPLGLAMAVEVPADSTDPKKMAQGGVRIVVYGSRDLFTNYWLTRSPSNADLLQNTVHWLAKRDRFAGVRPRSADLRLLTLTESQAQRLGLMAYAGVPSLFLLTGILIWWSRRS